MTKQDNHTYKHIVSLGFFCSPALELRRIGVRKASFPFDWLVSPSTETVLFLIKNNFIDFLNSEYMYQLKSYPSRYKNIKYNIDFYHDFDMYKSYDQQIDLVNQKYHRRINKFYSYIKEPTLFIRYITNQDDADYIQENYQNIFNYFKEFHLDNNLIFVANNEIRITNPNLNVFYVEKDKDDSVARKFLEKNEKLYEYIIDHFDGIAEPQKNTFLKSIKSFIKKAHKKLQKYYKKPYMHYKTL